MASDEEKNRLSRLQEGAGANLVPKIPPLPDDVRKRFPSLLQWEINLEEWRVKVNIALRGGPG